MAIPSEKITSLQNPRVKQLVKLRERRDRDEAGLFLIEGYREIRRALEKGVKPKEFYFSPDWFLGENEPALIEQARAAGAQLFELSKDAFAKVVSRPDRAPADEAIVPWFYRTLRNAAIDQFRRRGTAVRAIEAFAREIESAVAPEPEMEEEICACIARLASTLKPEYAEALHAIYVEGTAVKAFAQQRGLSPLAPDPKQFEIHILPRHEIERTERLIHQ